MLLPITKVKGSNPVDVDNKIPQDSLNTTSYIAGEGHILWRRGAEYGSLY